MEPFAAVLIAAGLATGVGALVVLHLSPTGLSPVRNAVSQYGITTYKSGYRVQTLGYALAGVGAAVAIGGLEGPGGLVVGLCVLFALARGAISWYPMDVPGARPTRTGRVHGVLAIGAFGAVGLAAQGLSTLLGHDHIHHGTEVTSRVLALLMLATFVAMAANRRARGNYFGFVERLFYVCMTVWLVVVAAMAA